MLKYTFFSFIIILRVDIMKFDNFIWDKNDRIHYIKYLESLTDLEYKKFNSSIVNTKLNIIGIRIPLLKGIAKEISKGNVEEYLKIIDKNYYESIMIYGLVLSKCSEEYIDRYIMMFLDCIDNWAICDTFCSSLKIVNKKLGKYWIYFTGLIDPAKEFQTRVSLIILMNYYLNDNYIDRVLNIVCNIKSDYYYINMGISWLLSVAIINYEDKVVSILESKCLSKFVQNKTFRPSSALVPIQTKVPQVLFIFNGQSSNMLPSYPQDAPTLFTAQSKTVE